MDAIETLLTVCLGIGLSAACGFRIFVPFLVISGAAHAGYISLSAGFDWIGSTPALIVLVIATILEIGAYYVPWLDNFLDSVGTPITVVAGIVLTSSVIVDMDPFLKWTLAVIAGGGAAGVVKGLTSTARLASTAATGGVGNPLITTVETGTSLVLSIVSVVVPLLAAAVVLGIGYFAGRKIYRFLRRRRLSSELKAES